MAERNLLFEAAIAWHNHGIAVCPNANSVQLVQAILEELGAARALLAERTDELRNVQLPEAQYHNWMVRATDLRIRTNVIQDVLRV